MSLVEQQLLTLSENLSSPRFLVRFMLLDHLFYLAIVLFVLRFTHSDYPFGIFNLIVSSCWDLCILCDVQASSLA